MPRIKMTDAFIEEQYVKHERLLWERAWSFRQQTGEAAQDLMSVCRQVFMECIRLWRPARGKLSVLLWISCTRRLITHSRKLRRDPCFLPPTMPVVEESIIEPNLPQPDYEAGFRDLLRSLGQEARVVVEVILGAPEELARELCYPTKQKRAIEAVCARRGLTKHFARKGMKELETRLQEEVI